MTRINPDYLNNLFVLDVEATSATPMTGYMTEFGIVNVGTMESFYGHLYVAHPHPDTPALPVVDTHFDGSPRQDVYSVEGGTKFPFPTLGRLAVAARTWVDVRVPVNVRPTLVSDNNGFDAMWFNCFTDSAGIGLVFGHSSRRIGDFYAGTRGKWSDQSSWKKLRKTTHTHNPVDDALGNAEALRTILGMEGCS